jgi:excinuclease ABC subunit A
MVREELAKYLNSKPCPECSGTRLRREARHVKVGNGADARAIFEVSNAPLKEASAYFARLTLDGQKQAIAEKIVKEIGSRLQFLNNVGLDYLRSTARRRRFRAARRSGSGSPRRSAPASPA